MKFIKGLTSFILMFCLSIFLLFTLLYGILNDSVFSFDANVKMLETTPLTEEITDVISIKYQTKLESVSLNNQLLLDFVKVSSSGVVGYVFSETETLPEVDVAFLKTYVEEEVANQLASSLIENLNLDELIRVVKDVPDGESVSKAVLLFVKDSKVDISKSDVDLATEIFIKNKTLEAQALKEKLIDELSYQAVDTSQMKETLSLQQFFDQLMLKNPFTLIRDGYEIIDKNLGFYLPVIIVLIVLMMALIEFKLSNSIIWFIIALVVAILPLQLIRVLSFFIQKDYINVFSDFNSYSEFMMTSMIKSLNIYTLIIGILIVLLIVLKKVLKTYVDDQVTALVDQKKNLWLMIRIGSFIVVILVSFLVGSKWIDYNKTYYKEIQEIQPDDFEPMDLDDVLSDGLNIDYDF